MTPALPQPPTHHTIHRQQLVPTLEASMAVSHTSRNDPGDVDGRVLLLAPHDVEAQALVCLGQLHYPGMCMALTGREGSHCGLGDRKRQEVRAPPWWACALGWRIQPGRKRLRRDLLLSPSMTCLPQFNTRSLHSDHMSLLVHFGWFRHVKEKDSIWCECVSTTQQLPISLFNRKTRLGMI